MNEKMLLFQMFQVLLLTVTTLGAKNVDEDHPYEFGFTIDGQQHRHEKKDDKGIIQGEFGFITADGIYHVTVYATDENGDFKILSMRNLRISAPLDGSPFKGEISPEANKYRKQANLAPLPQPNVLSLPENGVSVQSSVSTTEKVNKFTTQSTIRPACASCGLISTPKPQPVQPFVYQNTNGQITPNVDIESGSGNPGLSTGNIPPGYQAVAGPQSTNYNTFGVNTQKQESALPGGSNQELAQGNAGSQFGNTGGQYSSNVDSSPYNSNSELGQQENVEKGQQSLSQFGNSGPTGLEVNSQAQGNTGSHFGNTGGQYSSNVEKGQLENSGPTGLEVNNQEEASLGQGNAGSQFGNTGGQYSSNVGSSPYNSNSELGQQENVEKGQQGFSQNSGPTRLEVNIQGQAPEGNAGSQFGNSGGQYSNLGNSGYSGPSELEVTNQEQSPNVQVKPAKQPESFQSTSGLKPTGQSGQNPSPAANPLQLSENGPRGNVPSTLPPISVSDGFIHVGGDRKQDIPLKDKFPGMEDGLPAGIEEKDITNLLYKFHYTVGFHGHYEKGLKNGAKIGGYFVNGRDGISRVVTYIADENGYRPKVKFINLGLESDDTPKPETEKTFGLKSFEFVWYPL